MVIFASDRKYARHEAITHTARPQIKPASRHRAIVQIGLAGVLALVLGLTTNQALAKGNFTVDNQSSFTVRIEIFDGDDGVCNIPAKKEPVEAGTKKTFQCRSGGNDRCKIQTLKSGEPICTHINGKTCNNSNTRTIKDKQTLTITGDDNSHSCDASGGDPS